MRAGEEYDYFFEVDGEFHYDFDCEYSSVEVLDVSCGVGTNGAPCSDGAPGAEAMNLMNLSAGSIIIAN